MIKQAFESKKTVFIPFIMAGHPTLEESKQAIIALSEAGANIIELGVPFSDPVADGPVNQRAAEIALKQGTALDSIFAMVQELRSQGCHTPILLFTYLNPILALGAELFAIKAKEAGIQGVLVVDLPPEEGQDFYMTLKQTGLEIVLLASPTTDPQRFSLYKQLNPSFLYYISRLAVTGMQSALSDNLKADVLSLRTHFPNTKIAIGFGISNDEQAAAVAEFADGVIIGSLLVNSLEQDGLGSFKALAKTLCEAISKKYA
ncbi:MAG: tryptophan synthase subunit alpha [Legionellaceae bacterium]|nr:tryptophan synthase subunit alpha [Legionellaceae bacterium]